MVSKHGYKGTAKVTGISAGHVHKLVNLAEHDLLIATGKKILAGYKISKHL